MSVEAKVKKGPVTLLALTQTADGRLKMLASQGMSIPGDTLAIGNTNRGFSSRSRWSIG